MSLHVLGPLLMTELLRPSLRGHDARVVFVTSGGMYGQRLRADDPEFTTGEYSGTTAYARSKRAQVELLPVLADRWSGDGIGVHAMHPGWADTPGVVDSLPRFHKLTGPLLRDAALRSRHHGLVVGGRSAAALGTALARPASASDAPAASYPNRRRGAHRGLGLGPRPGEHPGSALTIWWRQVGATVAHGARLGRWTPTGTRPLRSATTATGSI